MPSAKVLNCDYCGTEFKNRADRVSDVNFCQLHCRKAWAQKQREETRGRSCIKCGVLFIPRVSQLKKGGGKYCSLDCSKDMHIGVKRSEETRQRMSAAIKNSPNLKPLKGKDNPSWNGGRYLSNGYWWLSLDEGKVAEHRHVMSVHLGRELLPEEIVHHINHDKQDNRIENLEIMTRSEHMDEHRPEFACKVKKGVEIGTSKLTEDSILEIRGSSESNSDLADRFGVTVTNIGYIRQRKTWKHL
jgi:hypothetical protein